MRKVLKPMTVEEQLRDLPARSVVLDSDGLAWQKSQGYDVWSPAQDDQTWLSSVDSGKLAACSRLTVVYDGGGRDEW